jgi:oligoribonuclease NrnB/cAMP/cGMP phosphodiesterase (DHH superfamily)
MYMPTVYHLSHIDLDGYGCQYLTSKYFETLYCYNANYGAEVMQRLEEILKNIKETSHQEPPLILVTDLNLTTKEANWLERQATEVGATLQLLDHHATGANASEKHDWYFLDTSRCATRITYEWLQKRAGFDTQNNYQSIVQAINAIDIWVDNDALFEYGKVMLGMIAGTKEISRIVFPKEDRTFKCYLIEEAQKRLGTVHAHIELDDDMHQIKKSFFKKEENNTFDNLVANYITHEVSQQRERLTIHYRGYKGILVYLFGRASVIGNACMVANPEYDFYMDINMRGNFSLRSNNKLDVSSMAAEIGDGGGHPNASGGKLEGFRESFVYSDIHAFVQNAINEIVADKTLE